MIDWALIGLMLLCAVAAISLLVVVGGAFVLLVGLGLLLLEALSSPVEEEGEKE